MIQENKFLKFLGFMWNPLSWVMEAAALMAIALANSEVRQSVFCYHFTSMGVYEIVSLLIHFETHGKNGIMYRAWVLTGKTLLESFAFY